LVEFLPSKQAVAGSSPVSRSNSPLTCFSRTLIGTHHPTTDAELPGNVVYIIFRVKNIRYQGFSRFFNV
jgi:hypothetical protein